MRRGKRPAPVDRRECAASLVVKGALVVALVLGAALHAFGAHLSVAVLMIAVTVAGVLASASPAGGGMGVAEAGLILALTAGGITKTRRRLRPAPFLGLPAAHRRLDYLHVDAQEGISVT